MKPRLYSMLAIPAAAATVATMAARADQPALPSHALSFGSIGATAVFGSESNRALAVLRRAGMSLVTVYVSWTGTAPKRRPGRSRSQLHHPGQATSRAMCER